MSHQVKKFCTIDQYHILIKICKNKLNLRRSLTNLLEILPFLQKMALKSGITLVQYLQATLMCLSDWSLIVPPFAYLHLFCDFILGTAHSPYSKLNSVLCARGRLGLRQHSLLTVTLDSGVGAGPVDFGQSRDVFSFKRFFFCPTNTFYVVYCIFYYVFLDFFRF